MSPSATMWFLDVLIRRILLKIWKTPQPRIGSFFFLALKPVVWNFCLPPSGIESNYTLTLLMHAYEVCLQASSRPPPSYPRNAHFKSSLKAGFIFLSGASETSFGCFLKYFRHWLRCAPSCCSLLLRFGRFSPFSSGKPIFACWRKTPPVQQWGNVATDTGFKKRNGRDLPGSDGLNQPREFVWRGLRSNRCSCMCKSPALTL